jgi:hypothetical protein
LLAACRLTSSVRSTKAWRSASNKPEVVGDSSARVPMR